MPEPCPILPYPVTGHGGVLSSSGRRERPCERKAENERVRDRAGENTEDGTLRETEGTAEQGLYLTSYPINSLDGIIVISSYIVTSSLTTIFCLIFAQFVGNSDQVQQTKGVASVSCTALSGRPSPLPLCDNSSVHTSPLSLIKQSS